MPRDKDKDNASGRGRRDGPAHKGRSGKPRGPEKKFAKRGFGGGRDEGSRFSRDDRDSRPRSHQGREDRGERRREFGDEPRRSFRDRKPDDRRAFSAGGDFRKDRPRKDFGGRDRGEEKPWRQRDDRRQEERGEGRGGDRPRFSRPRDGGGEDRPRFRDRHDERGGDRPRFSRPRDGGGEERPRFRDRHDERGGDRPRFSRPREGGGEDRPRFRDRQNEHGGDRPRFSRLREGSDENRPRFRERHEERGGDRPRSREHSFGEDRPKFGRPRFDRPREGRQDNRHEGRQEGRNEWQEHPRSEGRFGDRGNDRPRRDDERGDRPFAKRSAFGGRGAYRERRDDFDRKRDFDRRGPREEPKPKKTGERIAKVLARAGLASRRDAEEMVTQGRVTVNGRTINSPALDVTRNDVIAVDGKPLPPRERTRLFLYHKPRGLMTTHDDPEGRPTVFDNLPEGLPRLISIGRLDFNTEGLLLLTNDGGLARVLELPDTGWLRRYRVRAHGEVTQAQLDQLKNGIEVDGVKYGEIDATLERDQGANVWLVFAIREGKNREVRNVLAHLGLEVNRLIRVSYGPFQLAELGEGEVHEIKSRVLREQLGDKVIAQAGADFDLPPKHESREEGGPVRDKKPSKPVSKREVINDRKGRRVLVQRTGSEEARERNEMEAAGYGPPRRPKRGYHGKRDLTPREE